VKKKFSAPQFNPNLDNIAGSSFSYFKVTTLQLLTIGRLIQPKAIVVALPFLNRDS